MGTYRSFHGFFNLMYVHNYASRLDIHLNFFLQTEISGTPVFRLPSSVPMKKNMGLLAKKRISMLFGIKI